MCGCNEGNKIKFTMEAISPPIPLAMVYHWKNKIALSPQTTV